MKKKIYIYTFFFITISSLQIIFSISLSYVRPGTRFELTIIVIIAASLVAQKKRAENNMFQCNKIILEVSSQYLIKPT